MSWNIFHVHFWATLSPLLCLNWDHGNLFISVGDTYFMQIFDNHIMMKGLMPTSFSVHNFNLNRFPVYRLENFIRNFEITWKSFSNGGLESLVAQRLCNLLGGMNFRPSMGSSLDYSIVLRISWEFVVGGCLSYVEWYRKSFILKVYEANTLSLDDKRQYD